MATEKKYLDYDGLKYLWSKISTKISDSTDPLYEILNIEISTNQPGGGVSTTVTVTVDGKATNYSYNNSPISIKILGGKQYTVSFANIDGYKTPASVTYEAISDNSRTISVSYDSTILTVSMTSNQANDQNISSATATVGFSGKSVTVTNGGTVQIPTGTSTTITWNAISNSYSTPTSQTFTTAGATMSKTGNYGTTILTLNIKSNQTGSEAPSISGAKATIKCGSFSTTATSSGNVNIPTGSTCTITFSDVNSYKTPTALSFTSSGTTLTKTATYQSKKLTCVVQDDSGTRLSGVSVAVNGTTYTISSSKIFYFPFDTTVTFAPADLDGYTAPSSQTHSSNVTSATITLTYTAKSTDVYIINTRHKLYTASQWRSTSNHGTAMGVAIVSDESSFVIAPEFKRHWVFSYDWSTYNGGPISESSAFMEDDSDDALLNFDGKTLTSQIYSATKNLSATFTINALNNYYWSDNIPDTATGTVTGSPAVKYVYAYRFPDGTTGSANNYIGSWGQWTLLNDNKDKVNECLDLIANYNLDTMTYTTEFFSNSGYIRWVSSSSMIRWASKQICSRMYYNYAGNLDEPHYEFSYDNQNLSQYIKNWTEDDGWTIESPGQIIPFCNLPSNVTYA